MTAPFNVRHLRFKHREGLYDVLHIDAAPTKVERIGEGELAFDRQMYRCSIEVTVSPTGRSVQVYVDGERVR